MAEWLIIIFGSVVIGIACAWRLTGRAGIVCAGALPALGVLIWFSYLAEQEHRGGGAPMWLIAFVFAGTAAAVAGISGYFGARKLLGGIV